MATINYHGDKNIQMQITKSDFRLFREAPRHLWAKKHDRLDSIEIDDLLAVQGDQIEQLAREYLDTIILPQKPGWTMNWQETASDGPYLARADAILLQPDGNDAELYEIKSSTSVKPEHIEDTAFQSLIFRQPYNLKRVYLVLVNNEYILNGALDLNQLFNVEDITDKVEDILPDIIEWRGQAVQAALSDDPLIWEHCWKPKDCICLEVCHPSLPDGLTIYDIPRLKKDRKQELESMGIFAAKDVPDDFHLSGNQSSVVAAAKAGQPVMDIPGIRREIARIQYPVYFLDYETCPLAVPVFYNHKPYQQAVFQYSLHRLDAADAKPVHFEHMSTGEGDPCVPLLASLKNDLAPDGTVIVWNAPFEKTRNKEMGAMHPEFGSFLEDVNNRIYDLMEIVSKGLYLHPGFKGSSSIKNVLPVLVPELRYDALEINNGSKASFNWWRMMFTRLPDTEKQAICTNLLSYCELDTLAMVELFRHFCRF